MRQRERKRDRKDTVKITDYFCNALFVTGFICLFIGWYEEDEILGFYYIALASFSVVIWLCCFSKISEKKLEHYARCMLGAVCVVVLFLLLIYLWMLDIYFWIKVITPVVLLILVAASLFLLQEFLKMVQEIVMALNHRIRKPEDNSKSIGSIEFILTLVGFISLVYSIAELVYNTLLKIWF